jgi:hypothetical protein
MAAAAAEVVERLGLADRPAAYRAVAAEPTANAQIAKAREIAARSNGQSDPGTQPSTRLGALVQAWNDAGKNAQRKFLDSIGHSRCKQGSPPTHARQHSAKKAGQSGVTHDLNQSLKPQFDLFGGR